MYVCNGVLYGGGYICVCVMVYCMNSVCINMYSVCIVCV